MTKRLLRTGFRTDYYKVTFEGDESPSDAELIKFCAQGYPLQRGVVRKRLPAAALVDVFTSIYKS